MPFSHKGPKTRSSTKETFCETLTASCLCGESGRAITLRPPINLLCPRPVWTKMAPALGALGPQYTVLAVTNVTLRSEEHTSELQSLRHLVCRLLLEKKKKYI